MSNRTVPFCPCIHTAPFSPCGSIVLECHVVQLVMWFRRGGGGLCDTRRFYGSVVSWFRLSLSDCLFNSFLCCFPQQSVSVLVGGNEIKKMETTFRKLSISLLLCVYI